MLFESKGKNTNPRFLAEVYQKMKLKTLNDIAGKSGDCKGFYRICREIDLQQVAKEHIKQLREFTKIEAKLNFSDAEICWKNSERTVRTALAQIEWIKMFFNLEKGDKK